MSPLPFFPFFFLALGPPPLIWRPTDILSLPTPAPGVLLPYQGPDVFISSFRQREVFVGDAAYVCQLPVGMIAGSTRVIFSSSLFASLPHLLSGLPRLGLGHVYPLRHCLPRTFVRKRVAGPRSSRVPPGYVCHAVHPLHPEMISSPRPVFPPPPYPLHNTPPSCTQRLFCNPLSSGQAMHLLVPASGRYTAPPISFAERLCFPYAPLA